MRYPVAEVSLQRLDLGFRQRKKRAYSLDQPRLILRGVDEERNIDRLNLAPRHRSLDRDASDNYMGSSYPHVAKKKRLTIEDVLGDEIRREMNLDTKTFVVLDDWDSVMHSVYQLPIEYAGYTKKVADLK